MPSNRKPAVILEMNEGLGLTVSTVDNVHVPDVKLRAKERRSR
jgi:hypothetical protein